jgi:hypothetical protein
MTISSEMPSKLDDKSAQSVFSSKADCEKRPNDLEEFQV